MDAWSFEAKHCSETILRCVQKTPAGAYSGFSLRPKSQRRSDGLIKLRAVRSPKHRAFGWVVEIILRRPTTRYATIALRNNRLMLKRAKRDAPSLTTRQNRNLTGKRA
jgi:hypothetical protein